MTRRPARPLLRTILCCLLAVLAAAAFAAAPVLDARVRIGDGAVYGYWAPEIHEMYLKLPVTCAPIGGDERFYPREVTVDGKPAAPVYWYVDGHTIDFDPAPHASGSKIAAFVPVAWHGGESHEIGLRFQYGNAAGEQRVTIAAPKTGGAWAPAIAGNQAFLIREEAGLARQDEAVDVEVTIPIAQFPDPERMVRATLMRAPGDFVEIPCQVYEVEKYGETLDGNGPLAYVRFRAAVQLTMQPKSQALVHLWACAPRDAAAPAGALRLEGSALGGVVHNAGYDIELDRQSGQLYRWQEKRLGTVFEYVDPRKGVGGNQVVIHRTPDIFRTGVQWSHAFEWNNPENSAVAGPVFAETLRWGKMPWVPEAFSRISYRFVANRPEVRVASSMRVIQDMLLKGFRAGNMIFGRDLFTHIAWPRQDGSIARITLQQAYGNDMGAPPPARFPLDTPWVAFYNQKTKTGFAMVTANLAYFSEGPAHPNTSRQTAYASFYRGYFVYAIRSANQTYCAGVATYPTPMRAGTVLYEDVAYLPFSFAREDAKQFRPVERLLRELKNPLVVVP